MMHTQALDESYIAGIGPETPRHFEDCDQRIVGAERELAAFVTAVGEIYGQAVAQDAAECWLEVLERADLPRATDSSDWRRITIIASSRLVKSGRLRVQSADCEVEPC